MNNGFASGIDTPCKQPNVTQDAPSLHIWGLDRSRLSCTAIRSVSKNEGQVLSEPTVRASNGLYRAATVC
jgi:hypothetical protein